MCGSGRVVVDFVTRRWDRVNGNNVAVRVDKSQFVVGNEEEDLNVVYGLWFQRWWRREGDNI